MSNAIAPRWFTIVAVVAVIWNVLGIVSFGAQVTTSAEDLAALPDAEQALLASQPLWTEVIFGVAVITGTLGSLCLLLTRALATPLLAASLLAVIIQMGYWLALTGSFAVYGPTVVIMPALVVGIAIYLWLLSRYAGSNGWIG